MIANLRLHSNTYNQLSLHSGLIRCVRHTHHQCTVHILCDHSAWLRNPGRIWQENASTLASFKDCLSVATSWLPAVISRIFDIINYIGWIVSCHYHSSVLLLKASSCLQGSLTKHIIRYKTASPIHPNESSGRLMDVLPESTNVIRICN